MTVIRLTSTGKAVQKKKCNYCYKTKPITEYDIAVNNKSGYKSYCKLCKVSYKKSYNKYNRGRYVLQRGRKLKEELVNSFGNKCNICKNSFHISCYDFHHLDPKTKKESLSKLMSSGQLSKMYKEAKKCVMLCAHCHKILHYEENTRKYEGKINDNN